MQALDFSARLRPARLTERRSSGAQKWACIWRTFGRDGARGWRTKTWGFVGSLSDVCDLGSALRSLDLLSVETGTERGLGARRCACARALTRARLYASPELRKELALELGDAGFMGRLV